MSNLVLYSIPAFVVLVLLEVAWAKRHREVVGYETRDTFASLSLGLINVVINAGTKFLTIPLFAWCYAHRSAALPVGARSDR